MNKEQRRLAALAARIHDDLIKKRFEGFLREFPQPQIDHARQMALRLGRARVRRWNHITERFLDNYYHAICQLDRECGQIREQLSLMRSPPPLPHPREIFRDLTALKQESEQVTWNRKAGTLCVQSEAIELEGWYLGPFEIVLSWRQIGQGVPYRVVALDPHPAAGNSSTTHPHIQDEHVCEGDATLPIQSALTGCRLHDFFTIIRQLLQTYNSSSPYIPLERWDGAVCRECDTTVYEDDGSTCTRCDGLMCDDCTRRCCDCGEPSCSQCSQNCPGCQEDVCHSCSRNCADCDEEFCVNCLTENERCTSCHEDRETKETISDETSTTEVHPNSLGETPAAP